MRTIGIRAVEPVPNPGEQEIQPSGMDLFHGAAIQVSYCRNPDKFIHIVVPGTHFPVVLWIWHSCIKKKVYRAGRKAGLSACITTQINGGTTPALRIIPVHRDELRLPFPEVSL
jgi:hypothetical protein